MGLRSCRFNLILLVLIQSLLVSALPATRPQPSLSLACSANVTRQGFISKDLSNALSYFPPGIPEPHFFYVVPDTDLAVKFSLIGYRAHRKENDVHTAISASVHDSLDYRPSAKLPREGYKLQIGDILMAVSHSVGKRDLTYALWLMALEAMNGYTRAYPGFDFDFEIRKFADAGDMEGYNIGLGFLYERPGGGR